MRRIWATEETFAELGYRDDFESYAEFRKESWVGPLVVMMEVEDLVPGSVSPAYIKRLSDGASKIAQVEIGPDLRPSLSQLKEAWNERLADE